MSAPGTTNHVESLTGSANAVKGTRQRCDGSIMSLRLVLRHQLLCRFRTLVIGADWPGIGGRPHRAMMSSSPPSPLFLTTAASWSGYILSVGARLSVAGVVDRSRPKVLAKRLISLAEPRF